VVYPNRRASREWLWGARHLLIDSASKLVRAVDIDLAAYPILVWRWFIELPVRSPLDERTREGDDPQSGAGGWLRSPG
jgi:hypothetical protein